MCRWLLPVTTPSRSDRLQRQCDTGAGRGEGQGEGRSRERGGGGVGRGREWGCHWPE